MTKRKKLERRELSPKEVDALVEDLDEFFKEDYPLSFSSPESSNVAGAEYDPSTQQLTVTFKTGKSYGYAPFEEKLWVEFEQAESKGGFFAARVRPFFTGRAK